MKHLRKKIIAVLELVTCVCMLVNAEETEYTTIVSVEENTTTVIHPNTSQTRGIDLPNANRSVSTGKGALWIIHQGFVSQKQYELAAFILNAVLKPIVCIFGLIGNCLGIGVLFRKELRRSTYWYLCGLTVADTLYLLCSLIMTLPPMLADVKPKLSEYLLAHNFPYVNAYLALVFSNTSAWLITILSIERFMAVSRPLKIKDSFINRSSFFVCILTYLVAFLYYAPNMGIFETKTFHDPKTNDTTYKFGYRQWSETSGFRVIYGMVGTVLGMYIPMLTVVIMNIGIIIQTQVMRKYRIKYLNARDNQQSWQEQRKLNITLVIIAVFYVVSVAPRAVIVTMSKFDDVYTTLGREHFLLYVIIDFANLSLALNAANDFIVYYMVSDVIRENFRRRYGCLSNKKKTRESDNVSGTDPSVTSTTFSKISYDAPSTQS